MDLRNYYGDTADEKVLLARIEKVKDAFYSHEKVKPERLFSSSGRAEILGNHTDHNHGKVLVAAISCDILAAVKKTDDCVIKICSEGYLPFTVNVNDSAVRENEKGTSVALTRGVAAAIKNRGENIGGFTAYLTSNVFGGAGVSSSAAYEVLIAEILNVLYLDGKLSAVDKAIIAQYSENVYFGKPCGLLDQSGIAIGSLSALDFAVPSAPTVKKTDMIKGYTLVITNTGGSHAALTEHYAAIRSEMEQVAAYFGEKVLHDVPKEKFYADIKGVAKKISGRAALRAMHFYDENERVDEAVAALEKGDEKAFLSAVNGSGLSSLIRLQNCAVPGETEQRVVLGIELSREIINRGAVRVHGGGFAGSILAVIADEEVENYRAEMGKVFGKDNVFTASVRPLGTAEIK